jgi:hypothetical protein
MPLPDDPLMQRRLGVTVACTESKVTTAIRSFVTDAMAACTE